MLCVEVNLFQLHVDAAEQDSEHFLFSSHISQRKNFFLNHKFLETPKSS